MLFLWTEPRPSFPAWSTWWISTRWTLAPCRPSCRTAHLAPAGKCAGLGGERSERWLSSCSLFQPRHGTLRPGTGAAQLVLTSKYCNKERYQRRIQSDLNLPGHGHPINTVISCREHYWHTLGRTFLILVSSPELNLYRNQSSWFKIDMIGLSFINIF